LNKISKENISLTKKDEISEKLNKLEIKIDNSNVKGILSSTLDSQ
jgi:hypothetical protein